MAVGLPRRPRGIVAVVALLVACARVAHGERHAIHPHGAGGAARRPQRRRSGARRLLASVGVLAASANANLAEEREQSAEKLFAFLDQNKDGKIDYDEYSRRAHDMLIQHGLVSSGERGIKVLQQYKALFEKSDLDQDGSLSEAENMYLEFLASEVARIANKPPDDVDRDGLGVHKIDEPFRHADRNRDGVLDRSEFRQAVDESAPFWHWGHGLDAEMTKWVDAIFDKVHVRKGEALTMEEMQFAMYLLYDAVVDGRWSEKGLMEDILAMDANGDGMLHAAEVAAFRPVDEAGKRLKDEVERHFIPADADGDGHLEGAELEHLVSIILADRRSAAAAAAATEEPAAVETGAEADVEVDDVADEANADATDPHAAEEEIVDDVYLSQSWE